MILLSLKTALSLIINKKFLNGSTKDYFQIPENREKYVDLIIKNAKIKQIINLTVEKINVKKISFLSKGFSIIE